MDKILGLTLMMERYKDGNNTLIVTLSCCDFIGARATQYPEADVSLDLWKVVIL